MAKIGEEFTELQHLHMIALNVNSSYYLLYIL